MGGSIETKSTLGKGTTFKLNFRTKCKIKKVLMQSNPYIDGHQIIQGPQIFLMNRCEEEQIESLIKYIDKPSNNNFERSSGSK